MSNAKKSCAAEDRTPAYVSKKLQMLNDYWLQFAERHELFWAHEEKVKELFKDTDYFTKDPYLEIEDRIAQATAELTSWLPPPEPESNEALAAKPGNQASLA